ncbi:MAG: FKBP-type peptidyl-prolyl cis-trans isomerase [Thiotrichales bacterium]|nr:FKBP-type peptidyl-prolyl cis-trans isomerase [Thiotrichales bacterium]
MKILNYLPIIPAAVLGMALQAQAETELKTDKQKFSYTVGIQIGNNLKQGGDIDIEALTQAIRDVYNDSKYRLSVEEMQSVMQQYRDKEIEKRMAQAQSNRGKQDDFFTENRKQEGIVETDSGLQYKIIKAGDGKKPKADDAVEVHYRGTLIDGTEFDSSYKRGETVVLALANVIKGWQEALAMMPVGSKWQIFVPSELGYGERGAGTTIGPNETLIFDIELLAIR